MNKFIAKNLPSFNVLFWPTDGLIFLMFFNWAMSNIMGDDIVTYNDVCVVGEYNPETHTGSLTCGEYSVDSGVGKVTNFVGLAYVQKLPLRCAINVREYTDEVSWSCSVDKPEE